MKPTLLRPLALLLLALSGALPLSAQAPVKDVVVVEAFARSREVPAPYAEAIRQNVIVELTRHNRQRIVDAALVPALAAGAAGLPPTTEATAEADLAAFVAARRPAVMAEAGARFLLTGSVTGYRFEHVVPKEGKPLFRTTMTLLLTGYDMKLDKEIPLQIVLLKGEAPVAEDADRQAVTSLHGELTYYFYKHFRFETIILQLASFNKKGELKECYIHSGSDMGVAAGDLFEIFEEVPVGDITMRQPVGRLRVNSVTDRQVAKCKVTKGAREIEDAFKNGRPLIAVSSGKALFY